MALLRAVESGDTSRVRQLWSRLQEAKTMLDPDDPSSWAVDLRNNLRVKAVKLTRENTLEELHCQNEREKEEEACNELTVDLKEERLSERQKARQQLMAKIKQLSPGTSGSLTAVRNAVGDICTDPAEIAEALRQHWSNTFSHRPIEEEVANTWLEEGKLKGNNSMHSTITETSHPDWALERKHVRKALRLAGNSAPGPDGICFGVWRKLGPRRKHHLRAPKSPHPQGSQVANG